MTFFGNAQTNQKISIDELVSNFIKELQTQKIDTICVYKDYCVGCRQTTSDSTLCYSKEFGLNDILSYPVYIFWKKKGETYLNKISTCFEFSKMSISKNTFWDIYFSNEKKIKSEVIKDYQYETIENSKKTKYTTSVDHGGSQNFKFMINGIIIEKEIISFNFIKKDDYFPSNMNYDHNIKLKSKLLIDIFENITSEAEKNNTFKKIKSR